MIFFFTFTWEVMKIFGAKLCMFTIPRWHYTIQCIYGSSEVMLKLNSVS